MSSFWKVRGFTLGFGGWWWGGAGGSAGEARDEDQGDGVEEDGSGDELRMTLAQVLEEQLGGDQREGGVGEPYQFDALPARPQAGQRQRQRAGGERPDDGDVRRSGSDDGGHHPHQRRDQDGCHAGDGQGRREDVNDAVLPAI